MRLEQHVTFAWQLTADEDAIVRAALLHYLQTTGDLRADALLAARTGVSVGVAAMPSPTLQPVPIPRHGMPIDADLLAQQESDTP